MTQVTMIILKTSMKNLRKLHVTFAMKSFLVSMNLNNILPQFMKNTDVLIVTRNLTTCSIWKDTKTGMLARTNNLGMWMKVTQPSFLSTVQPSNFGKTSRKKESFCVTHVGQISKQSLS